MWNHWNNFWQNCNAKAIVKHSPNLIQSKAKAKTRLGWLCFPPNNNNVPHPNIQLQYHLGNWYLGCILTNLLRDKCGGGGYAIPLWNFNIFSNALKHKNMTICFLHQFCAPPPPFFSGAYTEKIKFIGSQWRYLLSIRKGEWVGILYYKLFAFKKSKKTKITWLKISQTNRKIPFH